jgi:hypothetical protein
MKIGKGASASFFRSNHCLCHPLLDFDWVMGIYPYAWQPWRWILANPIGTDRSSPFFSFFYRETTKKYFQSSKWGSIPKYPSQSAMKAVMC